MASRGLIPDSCRFRTTEGQRKRPRVRSQHEDGDRRRRAIVVDQGFAAALESEPELRLTAGKSLDPVDGTRSEFSLNQRLKAGLCFRSRFSSQASSL